MKTTQQSIQDSFNTFEQMPVIQVNNIENSVNINNGLSKESREVVINKVNEILAQLKPKEVIDVEVKDDA